MQLGPSTSQDFGVIPNEQHQNHHAPPPPPPGPPVKVNLKVNCLECQVKLKKKLQKMSGVKDVEIVPEQGGTVTVSGSIDSKVLMEVIRINYKKAVLVCPVDKNEPFCSKNQSKKCSCSDDEHDDSKEDDHHHHKVIAAKNNCDNDAGLISEPKNEKKRRMCGMMRCFGKASCPSTAIRPAPRPVQSPSPVPRPLMGFQANGYFPGRTAKARISARDAEDAMDAATWGTAAVWAFREAAIITYGLRVSFFHDEVAAEVEPYGTLHQLYGQFSLSL
ncbi:hypothetical protein ACLB2K_010582 [Fragaria x ananassa]